MYGSQRPLKYTRTYICIMNWTETEMQRDQWKMEEGDLSFCNFLMGEVKLRNMNKKLIPIPM
jgi:hypothetical protein